MARVSFCSLLIPRHPSHWHLTPQRNQNTPRNLRKAPKPQFWFWYNKTTQKLWFCTHFITPRYVVDQLFSQDTHFDAALPQRPSMSHGHILRVTQKGKNLRSKRACAQMVAASMTWDMQRQAWHRHLRLQLHPIDHDEPKKHQKPHSCYESFLEFGRHTKSIKRIRFGTIHPTDQPSQPLQKFSGPQKTVSVTDKTIKPRKKQKQNV